MGYILLVHLIRQFRSVGLVSGIVCRASLLALTSEITRFAFEAALRAVLFELGDVFLPLVRLLTD